jgi:hypothetical protein
MAVNLMDRSNYFKGLLILSKVDEDIAYQEIEILKTVGEKLGFNKEFCDNTINEAAENKHIKNEPLKFSNQQIANMFIRDGIKLAFSDSNFHEKEYEWIHECAKANNISESRINELVTSVLNSDDKLHEEQLEVINYDWQSFTLPHVKINTNKKTER